jgi:hypothetical protein
MAISEDRSAFHKRVREEFIRLNLTGNAVPLRNMFRTATDSYEQRYIYGLLTDDVLGVARYIKPRDLFKVDPDRLDPAIESNMDKLSRLFNFHLAMPGKMDFSAQGKYGYIYVMENASMPGWLKIGFTTISAVERARQLSSTSVAHPFLVRYLARVRKPAIVERQVHEQLTAYRVNPDREFFAVSLDTAVAAIESTATYIRHQNTYLYL